MTDTFKPFRCADCGAFVKMQSAVGEKREFRRGISVDIPPEVEIPKCEGCGEVYLRASDSKRVDAAVRRTYLARQVSHYRRMLESLQQELNLTLREIEDVCGVTGTYLSQVAGGHRVASTMLTRLVEMFARHPEDLAAYRAGVGGGGAKAFLQVSSADRALHTARGRWGNADVVSSGPQSNGSTRPCDDMGIPA